MRSKTFGFWMLFTIFVILPVTIHLFADPNRVTLAAKSWNEGKVHVWNNLNENAGTTFVDVADGTRCQRLDSRVYELPPDPPIRYYRLNCNGVSGYVEIDQVR